MNDGWMDRQIDEWIDGQMDGWLSLSLFHILPHSVSLTIYSVNLIIPKSVSQRSSSSGVRVAGQGLWLRSSVGEGLQMDGEVSLLYFWRGIRRWLCQWFWRWAKPWYTVLVMWGGVGGVYLLGGVVWFKVNQLKRDFGMVWLWEGPLYTVCIYTVCIYIYIRLFLSLKILF